MRLVVRLKPITLLFTLTTVVYTIRTNQTHGTFLGVPFEFWPLTPRRLRELWWNLEDDRILTPHVFGV